MTTLHTPPAIAPAALTDGGVAVSQPADRSLFAIFMQFTKARLSALVLLTTAVGYVLAASTAGIDWLHFMWTLLGTALAAGCASAINQIMEVQRDRQMIRTQNRPLPTGELSFFAALSSAMLMGAAGVGVLLVFVNAIAASLALLTILIYVLAYTPLKPRTTLNTLVGAICGGIPPMIGWVAVTGTIDGGAWLLAAILFVWQIPHFLALAWLYRADYSRGGFMMLPVLDRDGLLTTRVVVLTAALMLPLALLATLMKVAGPVYAVGSILLGLWFVALSLRLYFNRTDRNARTVFLASIAYLPLLLCLMVIDRA